MADEDEEQEEQEVVVELGEGESVEGAPLARVTSRLTWPKEASLVRRKEGDSVIRTPEGPRELGDVLDEVDETYFESRRQFTEAVEAVVGTGPVETAE
ncbi:MAG: DUF5789 family protein [Haloferacaceae archaeon]